MNEMAAEERGKVLGFIYRMRERMKSGGNVPYIEFADVFSAVQKQIDELREVLEKK